MKFDDKLKELDVLVEEANNKRIQASKELSQINDWINELKKRQKDIMKTYLAAERNLQGHSVEKLQKMLSEILLDYKSRNGFLFDFYGTDNIDIEKAISEKVFLNKIIEVMGGNRIEKYYHSKDIEKGFRKGKLIAMQKSFLRKMMHKDIMKAIEPYIIDKNVARRKVSLR